jgi:hypothetical protein
VRQDVQRDERRQARAAEQGGSARTNEGGAACASTDESRARTRISSKGMTCDELLAIPETYKQGNVNFIVTTAWKLGTHPLTSAEILEDDTRKITNIYPEAGTIEIVAAPENVGERGTIVLSATAAEGGAKGTIEVVVCE